VRQLPDLDEPALAREIQTAAYRLRLLRDKTELAQVEVMLRDQDEERNAADEVVLRERVDFLGKRIIESQKALDARTLFKPHAYNAV
jgi:hypothetical protein